MTRSVQTIALTVAFCAGFLLVMAYLAWWSEPTYEIHPEPEPTPFRQHRRMVYDPREDM